MASHPDLKFVSATTDNITLPRLCDRCKIVSTGILDNLWSGEWYTNGRRITKNLLPPDVTSSDLNIKLYFEIGEAIDLECRFCEYVINLFSASELEQCDAFQYLNSSPRPYLHFILSYTERRPIVSFYIVTVNKIISAEMQIIKSNSKRCLKAAYLLDPLTNKVLEQVQGKRGESYAGLGYTNENPNAYGRYPVHAEFKQSISDTETIDWRLAETWIRHCQAGHLDCRMTPGLKLPTRLISLHSNTIKLCTTESFFDTPRYCTLSHCWGQEPSLRLLKANMAILEKEVPVDLLSKTFKDTIIIAIHLGFEYLWVDSLCIIQDSPEDWTNESATMANVYRGSSLNIAATAAKDGRQGCFTETSKQKSFFISSRGNVSTVFSWELWVMDVTESPLAQRGWVMQERALAIRTLHFTQSGLYWECCETTACETIPGGPGSQHIKGMTDFIDIRTGKRFKLPPASSWLSEASWIEMIEQYTKAKLTFESDKLVAVSGMARYLHSRTGDGYCAGLWRKTLIRQLGWTAVQWSVPAVTRPSEYRAPSWSWASLDGEINFPSTKKYTRSFVASVIRVDIELASEDPFGKVKWASLRMKCGALRLAKERPGRLSISIDVEPVGSLVEPDSKIHSSQQYLVLPLKIKNSKMTGLILEATEILPGQYRRIGILSGREKYFEVPCEDHKFTYEEELGSDEEGNFQYIITLV